MSYRKPVVISKPYDKPFDLFFDVLDFIKCNYMIDTWHRYSKSLL